MTTAERIKIIEASCKQVGRGVFFSTLIIVASFLPVFLLEGQEGKLFGPLAWTKTFILAIDAILAVTLAPVLISFFLKGKLRTDDHNPLNRGLEKIYRPILNWCVTWRKTTLTINIIALLISIPLLLSLGSEFMPPLDEGTILFMPVTQPDNSNSILCPSRSRPKRGLDASMIPRFGLLRWSFLALAPRRLPPQPLSCEHICASGS